MYLKNLKLTDLDKTKKYNFILPFGATEQHGPFLPFGTDSIIIDKIVELVEKSNPDLIILPTMEITCSEEHREFLGTLYISVNTFKLVLSDLIDSIKPIASKIFLVSGHGGNHIPIHEFLSNNQSLANMVHYIEYVDESVDQEIIKELGGPIDDHAGNTEISMVKYINADLVLIPKSDYPKVYIENAFETNNIADKSKDGIADNHPKWVISEELGKKMLELSAGLISQEIASLTAHKS